MLNTAPFGNPDRPDSFVESEMKKSPLAIMKERFGDDRSDAKSKLVAEVRALADAGLWIDRVGEDKGLERVSNKKLLRLHATLSRVKSDFGSRDALIDAILTHEKRSKDDGYRTRLQGQPTPRLLDHHDAAQRRAARA